MRTAPRIFSSRASACSGSSSRRASVPLLGLLMPTKSMGLDERVRVPWPLGSLAFFLAGWSRGSRAALPRLLRRFSKAPWWPLTSAVAGGLSIAVLSVAFSASRVAPLLLLLFRSLRLRFRAESSLVEPAEDPETLATSKERLVLDSGPSN